MVTGCGWLRDTDVSLDVLHVYASLALLAYYSGVSEGDLAHLPDASPAVSVRMFSGASKVASIRRSNAYYAPFLVRSAADADPELVLVFCGSNDGRTFLVNLVPSLAQVPIQGLLPGARVHRGYRDYYYKYLRQDVLADVDAYLALGYDAPGITVVGHSLGGACATICALDLFQAYLQHGVSVGCITFGAPPVGNREFCEAFNRAIRRSCRVVDQVDPAPRIEIMCKNLIEPSMTLPDTPDPWGPRKNPIVNHYMSSYVDKIQDVRARLRVRAGVQRPPHSRKCDYSAASTVIRLHHQARPTCPSISSPWSATRRWPSSRATPLW